MIKLVEVEPLVCEREHNLSEIFIALLVLYFDLYLRAILEFFRIFARLKLKRNKKACFKILDKRCWEHFILRVQGELTTNKMPNSCLRLKPATLRLQWFQCKALSTEIAL